MDLVLKEYIVLIRQLRRANTNITVEDMEQFFDQLILILKSTVYRHHKTNGLNILTVICDNLASIHTTRLLNHPILINHPVFIHIDHTFEMLLTKSNHSKSIIMNKFEENAFNSISYFISQLCLHRNEAIESFYGKISDEVFPITQKPNVRDNTINISHHRERDLTGKPNIKVARLQPNAPKARPVQVERAKIDAIPRRKSHSNRWIQCIGESVIQRPSFSTQLSSRNLPIKTYQEIFLTSTFFDKLEQSINDLSQNEYSPYHVKYKVIDRLVRLCSKMNAVNSLHRSIIKCLCSKIYYQMFGTIEPGQLHLTPKQLFFTYRCPQFIIQHGNQYKDETLQTLCSVMIATTRRIIDQILPCTGK